MSIVSKLASLKLVALASMMIFTTSVQADCSTFDLRSINSKDKRELIVVNKAKDRSAKLYWLDFNGKKVLYATIPPLGKHKQSTFRTHPWVVENSLGYCDSVFVVENNVEIIVK
ncbi:MAG: VHL beta domain-containing protein [bacterium]